MNTNYDPSYKSDDFTLGENIRYYRKRKQLSAQKLAEIIGLKSAQAVLQYERNEREPNQTTLNKICSALNVAPWDIVPLPTKLANSTTVKFTFPPLNDMVISDKLEALGLYLRPHSAYSVGMKLVDKEMKYYIKTTNKTLYISEEQLDNMVKNIYNYIDFEFSKIIQNN